MERIVYGVVDADPIALGICVGLVAALAVTFTAVRLRRRAR
jgi:hypothetical protein